MFLLLCSAWRAMLEGRKRGGDVTNVRDESSWTQLSGYFYQEVFFLFLLLLLRLPLRCWLFTEHQLRTAIDLHSRRIPYGNRTSFFFNLAFIFLNSIYGTILFLLVNNLIIETLLNQNFFPLSPI
jgi:hypothetical protein